MAVISGRAAAGGGALFEVKAMQQPMRERGKYQCRHRQENHATVERVEHRKQFSTIRVQHINRAHAAENHRRIQRRIQPAESFQFVVAQDANCP